MSSTWQNTAVSCGISRFPPGAAPLAVQLNNLVKKNIGGLRTADVLFFT